MTVRTLHAVLKNGVTVKDLSIFTVLSPPCKLFSSVYWFVSFYDLLNQFSHIEQHDTAKRELFPSLYFIFEANVTLRERRRG